MLPTATLPLSGAVRSDHAQKLPGGHIESEDVHVVTISVCHDDEDGIRHVRERVELGIIRDAPSSARAGGKQRPECQDTHANYQRSETTASLSSPHIDVEV